MLQSFWTFTFGKLHEDLYCTEDKTNVPKYVNTVQTHSFFVFNLESCFHFFTSQIRFPPGNRDGATLKRKIAPHVFNFPNMKKCNFPKLENAIPVQFLERYSYSYCEVILYASFCCCFSYIFSFNSLLLFVLLRTKLQEDQIKQININYLFAYLPAVVVVNLTHKFHPIYLFSENVPFVRLYNVRQKF